MTLLAKRYATALHGAARAQGAVDAVLRDLAALHTAMQDRAVRSLWLSPDVRGAERARTAQKLGQGRSPLIANLLAVLLRRRRQEVLPDLYPAFRTLVLQERGEVEGVVETPRPLGQGELQQLEQMAQRLCGRKCSLAVTVRPELIGGVRLIVGNTLYDGSVQATLAQLEQQLLKVPM